MIYSHLIRSDSKKFREKEINKDGQHSKEKRNDDRPPINSCKQGKLNE